MKVLFHFDAHPDIRAYVEEKLLPCEFQFSSEKDVAKKNIEASDADVIVGWDLRKEVIGDAKKLQLFICPAAGVNKPLENLGEQEPWFTFCNSHGNFNVTATHGIALLLATANKIVTHHNLLQDGKWRSRDESGITLPIESRKIGLLGYGHIGKRFKELMSGFDLEWHVMKRSWTEEQTFKTYGSNELHQLLKEVDILVITLPGTKDTEGLIGKRELELLGPQGILVNIGRGEVLEEEAFYNALKSKTINRAATDVWYNYKPEADGQGKKRPYSFPFHELDNLVLSPHRAGTPDSYVKRYDDVIYNINQFLSGEKNYVNVIETGSLY